MDGQSSAPSFPVPPSSSHAPPPTPPGAESATPGFLTGIMKDNPYFSAGFGLMGVGVALGVLRQGLMLGTTLLNRRLLVKLEMNNKDPAFHWFLNWMAQRQAESALAATPAAAGAGRALWKGKGRAQSAVRWLKSHEVSVKTTVAQRMNGSSFVDFDFIAGPGTHYFNYEGAWMQIKRERELKGMSMNDSMPWETVTLTTLSRDRTLFPRLLAEARDLSLAGKEGKLVIHTPWNTDWKPFGQPRQKRPLRSVVLQAGVVERIEADLRAFLDRRQWYADRGIPYRRGYLFHGPPGSGKTSFIQALAGHFSYDICLLNLSERGLGDDKLFHQLANVPEHSIVLIEDVDAAFNKRVQTSEDGYQSSVTFSGFLNALDGVASGEQRIIFLTTNHLDRLDPALIRPGRVDVSQLIDDASPEQAQRLFTQFYGDEGMIDAEQMGQELSALLERATAKGKRVSMAALQGIFIRNGPEEAMRTCRELLS